MDTAKGLCIIAVVTLYTTTHVGEAFGTTSWMQYWVDFARPFRMPDFYFISGLLLSRVIDRPWRTYADKKVLHYLWFFVVWSLIYFVGRLVVGNAGENPPQRMAEFVKVMTWGPFAMLWFIQLLPFYLVITKLLRRVPWPLMFAAAVVWYLLPIDTPWTQVNRAGERFVFFYAGYALANAAFAFADGLAERPTRTVLAGLAAWAGVNGLLVFSGAAEQPLVELALGFAGAFGVIGTAVLIGRAPRFGWVRVCGERSLPIYVGFYLPMSLLLNGQLMLLRAPGWPAPDPGVLAVALAAASIAAALLMARLAEGTRFAWLYERPGWARLRTPVAAAAAH